jgi:uncharacterized protein (TIGR04222 family)
MAWLFDNAVANMPGPSFLALYAVVCGLLLLACWAWGRLSDPSGSPPPVPENPDPYEIAWLRGRENEVIRLAVFDLVQRGCLRVTTKRGWWWFSSAQQMIEQDPDEPPPGDPTPIQRTVLDHFVVPQSPGDLFKSSLPGDLRWLCAELYEEPLAEADLVPSEAQVASLHLAGFLAGVAIVGLGAYKLTVALLEGRWNVWFLIAMGIASLVALFHVCRTPSLTRAGRQYLERLQTAYAGLRDRASRGSEEAGPDAAADPLLLTVVAVYGVQALDGTAYAPMHEMFHRSANSGGGCGAGCGGGDGGGGGCGGCGGCGG